MKKKIRRELYLEYIQRGVIILMKKTILGNPPFDFYRMSQQAHRWRKNLNDSIPKYYKWKSANNTGKIIMNMYKILIIPRNKLKKVGL